MFHVLPDAWLTLALPPRERNQFLHSMALLAPQYSPAMQSGETGFNKIDIYSHLSNYTLTQFHFGNGVHNVLKFNQHH
jgi:hypothetical protein